jgi:hypothetical protein
MAPWESMDFVALATRQWVRWFNFSRLLKPIGHMMN